MILRKFGYLTNPRRVFTRSEPFVMTSKTTAAGLPLDPRMPPEVEEPGTDGPGLPEGNASS